MAAESPITRDDVGPEGSTDYEVYLRTGQPASIPRGWAHFDHVKMRDYRWGIFLNPGDENRQIHFGDHKGEMFAWQEVPGEHRANLRRIPHRHPGRHQPASVEQQRHLGLTSRPRCTT